MLLSSSNNGQQQAQEKVRVHKATHQCTSAEKAIVFYRAKTWSYQKKLNETPLPTNHPERKKNACAYKRFVVGNWRVLAKEHRAAYEKWEYNYAWWKWLPSKWQRIAHCETAKGKYVPGDWHHSSTGKPNSGFQGAFGFAASTWDGYKPPGAPSEAYQATPRQQYQTALNVYADYGYSAWGCGGA